MTSDLVSSSETGLTLIGALEEHSDPKLWHSYLRLYKSERSDPITYYHPRALDNLGNRPTAEQVFRVLESELQILLHSEKLWGIGYLSPVGPEDSPVVISADKWRLLKLDFGGNTAAAEHLSFSGVLIFDTLESAKRNSAALSERLHPGEDKPHVINLGGRPPKYDWEAFYCEVVRIANTPDGLPEKQADLQRQMAEWFQETYAKEPAESEIKKRVRRIYQSVSKEGEN